MFESEKSCYLCPCCAERECKGAVQFPSHLTRFAPDDAIYGMKDLCERYPERRGPDQEDVQKPQPSKHSLGRTLKGIGFELPLTRSRLKGLLQALPVEELRTPLLLLQKLLAMSANNSNTAQIEPFRRELDKVKSASSDELAELLLDNRVPGYNFVEVDIGEQAQSDLAKLALAYIKEVNREFDFSTTDAVPAKIRTEALSLGGSGHTLGWHTDWQDACNFFLPVYGDVAPSSAKGDLKCKWWLVSPEKAEQAVEWLEELSRQRKGRSGKLVPSAMEWQVFEQQLGEEKLYAMHFEQEEGELVHVPPGWLHLVVNPKPCLCFKFANAFGIPAHLSLYVDHVHKTGKQWFSPHIACETDTACLESLLVRASREYRKDLSEGLSRLIDRT